jgi:spectinomycin phosphotransferase
VDWDQPILAPKERDLMFVLGAVGGDARTPRQEDLFFQGYGSREIDPLTMAYYRYEWVVQEIGAWGEDVFLRDDVGDETRQDSAVHFRYLFDPGDVVEAAYESESRLSG